MTLFWAEVAAGFLAGIGCLFLGVYIGLGVAEDREAERHARIALARIEARQAARPPILYLFHASAVDTRPPTFYRPGYAEAFPRAGRLSVDPGQLADLGAEAPELPHGPDLRPITSPVDLAGAVRLMCIETELYVAALIAGTHHTERNGNQ